MNESIKPNSFFRNIPSMQIADNQAARNGANDEERALYAMSQSKGWLILKEFTENLSDELGNINKVAIENGSSLEEIGRNTVVVNLAQTIIERILNKVSDATEACTSNEQ